MPEITEYKVVESDDNDSIKVDVEFEMSLDWQPFGGVGFNRNTGQFIQAMVKYKAEPVKKPCHNYTE